MYTARSPLQYLDTRDRVNVSGGAPWAGNCGSPALIDRWIEKGPMIEGQARR